MKVGAGVSIFFLTLLFATNGVLSQTVKSTAIRVATIDKTDGDGLELGYLSIDPLLHGATESGTTIAIRVCSKRPLLIALDLRKNLTVLFGKQLGELGIHSKRILYLRYSQQCPDSFLDAHVEYWLVPESAELPAFDELRLASNLVYLPQVYHGKQFYTDEFGKETIGEKVVSSNLRETAARIGKLAKSKQHSVVSIQFCFDKTQRKEGENNLSVIKDELIKAGVAETRIYWSRSRYLVCSSIPDIAVLFEN